MGYLILILSLFCISLNASAKCDSSYIPPHTEEELYELRDWSAGGAFSAFAELAGYEFDNQAYRESCVNVAIFNFGRHMGPQCTSSVDVMNGYFSMFHVLQNKFANDRENFATYFYEKAARYGFDQYLYKIEEE